MATENSIVITRVFAAPAERIFAAWTDSELLKQWMGPGPVTVSIAEVDLTVGGSYTLVMNSNSTPSSNSSSHSSRTPAATTGSTAYSKRSTRA